MSSPPSCQPPPAHPQSAHDPGCRDPRLAPQHATLTVVETPGQRSSLLSNGDDITEHLFCIIMELSVAHCLATKKKDADNVDWVVILDADMIIQGPIIPWELGAEKGKPVATYYGYLVGCDNLFAQLHTKHSELCDKVGGLLTMHIDDLRALAPLWLSKMKEVREDRAHWWTNLTGDIYGQGWISEIYGYSFGAAEVELRYKISDDLMIYPGYIPRPGVEPILLHFGLPIKDGNWYFSKLEHHEDGIVYECNHLIPRTPHGSTDIGLFCRQATGALCSAFIPLATTASRKLLQNVKLTLDTNWK